MLAPTLFFFVCFNLIVLTVALLSDDHELSAVSHISATIGALLVGKAFLLADRLPFTNRFIGHPLIYGALWSALIYFAMTIVLHLAERLLSAATGSRGFLFTAKADVATIDWPMFLVVQLWLALLLVVFAISRAATNAIGPRNIRRIFLSKPGTDDR
ncbi:hypothetical protein [Cribrihabitans marinus]|nr:hypothetical protein [Cribrihabitans marinus]GGH21124.1 hypothetical protein GCM10010973_05520 [Cribrihabitans marinus]